MSNYRKYFSKKTFPVDVIYICQHLNGDSRLDVPSIYCIINMIRIDDWLSIFFLVNNGGLIYLYILNTVPWYSFNLRVGLGTQFKYLGAEVSSKQLGVGPSGVPRIHQLSLIITQRYLHTIGNWKYKRPAHCIWISMKFLVHQSLNQSLREAAKKPPPPSLELSGHRNFFVVFRDSKKFFYLIGPALTPPTDH